MSTKTHHGTTERGAKSQRTFREQLEQVRLDNARRAFERGLSASQLRLLAASSGRGHSARVLAKLKQSALFAAFAIAPEVVRVGIDGDRHIGLLTVSFPGRGRLHLPHPATPAPWSSACA